MRHTQDCTHHLESLLRAKRDLLGIISHDTRNPLTQMIMANDLAAVYLRRDEPDIPGALKMIATVQRSAARQQKQLEDLMCLVRSEREAMEISADPVDVGHFLGTIVDNASLQAESKHVTLRSENLSASPGDLLLDAAKTAQVLNNLVHNALKFTPRGGTVTLTAKHDGGTLEFIVEDTGIGMNQEVRDGLFIPFTRVGRKGTSGEPELRPGPVDLQDLRRSPGWNARDLERGMEGLALHGPSSLAAGAGRARSIGGPGFGNGPPGQRGRLNPGAPTLERDPKPVAFRASHRRHALARHAALAVGIPGVDASPDGRGRHAGSPGVRRHSHRPRRMGAGGGLHRRRRCPWCHRPLRRAALARRREKPARERYRLSDSARQGAVGNAPAATSVGRRIRPGVGLVGREALAPAFAGRFLPSVHLRVAAAKVVVAADFRFLLGADLRVGADRRRVPDEIQFVGNLNARQIVDQCVVRGDDVVVAEEPTGLHAEEVESAATGADPQLVERADDPVVLVHDLAAEETVVRRAGDAV